MSGQTSGGGIKQIPMMVVDTFDEPSAAGEKHYSTTFTTIRSFSLNVTNDMKTLHVHINGYHDSGAVGQFRIESGGNVSNTYESGTSAAWGTCSLDVSSMSGITTFNIQVYTASSTTYGAYYNYHSISVET